MRRFLRCRLVSGGAASVEPTHCCEIVSGQFASLKRYQSASITIDMAPTALSQSSLLEIKLLRASNPHEWYDHWATEAGMTNLLETRLNFTPGHIVPRLFAIPIMRTRHLE